MRCETTQRRLSEYVEAELPERARRRVARHLDRCPDCGLVFRSLAWTVDALRSLRPPPSTSTSLPAIIERIGEESRHPPAPEARGLRWALGVCAQPASLRRTLRIALVVGIVLTAVNQGDVIADGRITWVTGAKIGANFLVPFVVSNLGLLAGARGHAEGG